MEQTVGMFVLVNSEDLVDIFVDIIRGLDLDSSKANDNEDGDRCAKRSLRLAAVAKSTIALPAI